MTKKKRGITLKFFIESIVLNSLFIAELDITFLLDTAIPEAKKLNGNNSKINYKDGVKSSLKMIFAIIGIFICLESFLGMEI